MHQEVSAQVHSFGFHIRDNYDEREIEELLETLEGRGADYEHLGDGWYVVTVPEYLGWVPFYRTVQNCDSVREMDHRKIVRYECEPEG